MLIAIFFHRKCNKKLPLFYTSPAFDMHKRREKFTQILRYFKTKSRSATDYS